MFHGLEKREGKLFKLMISLFLCQKLAFFAVKHRPVQWIFWVGLRDGSATL
jgi:hypothetical protein